MTVVRDGSLRAAGLRLGDAVVFDWGFEIDGRSYDQRSFVLLDDGFLIDQPAMFPAARRGWWYRDLVTVTDRGAVVLVDDLWIDVLVSPDDVRLRVVDLDEYAAALERGTLGAGEAADGLRRTQRFLDRHFGGRDDAVATWPDFPPAAIADLVDVSFAREWSFRADDVAG